MPDLDEQIRGLVTSVKPVTADEVIATYASLPSLTTGIVRYRRPRRMNNYAIGAAAMATAICVLVLVLVLGVASLPKSTLVSPGPSTAIPASWQKVTFGGLTMYAPGDWTVGTESAWGECGLDNQPFFKDNSIELDTGANAVSYRCPSFQVPPMVPSFTGLLVDPGPNGPLDGINSFGRCLSINDLSVCPTEPNSGILVLAVHIPGRAQPVAVEIGLAGGGKVARTIEYSMRPAASKPIVPPTTPTTVASTSGGPWPSLVYTGPGLAVLGISPEWDGYEGTKPSRLYLSTDVQHWTDITPPQSQVAQNGIYGYFDHASFISTSVGWVTAYNNFTDGVTIYRTSDAGKTWSTLPGGSHTFKGDMLIQLLSPFTAIRQILEPTAPEMSLGVTTNGGETWRTVYTGPRGVMTGQRALGPFLMPTTFVDGDHGFAATGDPQTYTAGPGDGDFFTTTDGGSRWTLETPPLPSTTDTCPSGEGETSSTSCIFATPTFEGPSIGVLPGIVVSGLHANVGFDVTTDGGMLWTLQSQRTATVPAESGPGNPFNYPLVSVPSPSAWWIVGWSQSQVTTQVTGDSGASWADTTTHVVGGVPIAFDALNANDAFLTLQNESPNVTSGLLLLTTDGGRTWKPVVLGK